MPRLRTGRFRRGVTFPVPLPKKLDTSRAGRRIARWSRLAVATGLTAWLAACGTVVPALTETVALPDDQAGELMVQAIVRSVRCELRHAVTNVVNEDLDRTRIVSNMSRKTYSNFLNDWGAEVALTLTIREKTVVGPNAIFTPATPASALVTVTAGLNLTAEATRIEKLNFFYKVKDLYLAGGVPCDASGERSYGSYLVHNDLKIESVLRSRINATAFGQAPDPRNSVKVAGDTNVISHQITFQVIMDGSITPSVKLVRATINPAGPFLEGNRDRTHDLLITFGPLEKATGGQSLISIAEQSHFSSQITSGFRTAFPQ